jgi:hypothetical protein
MATGELVSMLRLAKQLAQVVGFSDMDKAFFFH